MLNRKKISQLMISVFAVMLIAVFAGCGKNQQQEGTSKADDKTKTEQVSKNNSDANSNSHSNHQSGSSDKMNMKHASIQVKSMQCDECKDKIEDAVRKVDGVSEVSVDKKEKVAHVDFDNTKTDLGKIESSIVSAGYDANDKKANPDAYKHLDDCCKLPKDRKKK